MSTAQQTYNTSLSSVADKTVTELVDAVKTEDQSKATEIVSSVWNNRISLIQCTSSRMATTIDNGIAKLSRATYQFLKQLAENLQMSEKEWSEVQIEPDYDDPSDSEVDAQLRGSASSLVTHVALNQQPGLD